MLKRALVYLAGQHSSLDPQMLPVRDIYIYMVHTHADIYTYII